MPYIGKAKFGNTILINDNLGSGLETKGVEHERINSYNSPTE